MLLNTYVRVRTMLICRKAQGMTEYLLLVGLVAIALIAIIVAMSGTLKSRFQEIMNKIRGARFG